MKNPQLLAEVAAKADNNFWGHIGSALLVGGIGVGLFCLGIFRESHDKKHSVVLAGVGILMFGGAIAFSRIYGR